MFKRLIHNYESRSFFYFSVGVCIYLSFASQRLGHTALAAVVQFPGFKMHLFDAALFGLHRVT